MTARPLPDRDTLLMMLSAYLDGELAAADEAMVLDAMSQDPALLEAFEAMSALRIGSSALSDIEGNALTASILAATAPAETPDTLAGALELANLQIDDALDGAGVDRLHSVLAEKPALAPAVAGFVASVEAVQAAARAVSSISSVVDALRHVPDHVDAQVAARERAFVLSSSYLDNALTDGEAAELMGALPAHGADGGVLAFASSVHVGEALRVAATGPSFATHGKKAGEAALHAIEAERLQTVSRAAAQSMVAASPTDSLLSRLLALLAPARAPLAFAAAAAALFFVVKGPAEAEHPDHSNDVVAMRAANSKALFDALAPAVLGDTPDSGDDLPILADNSADVEALDATASTVVFSTENSNITVIWVASDDEQGT